MPVSLWNIVAGTCLIVGLLLAPEVAGAQAEQLDSEMRLEPHSDSRFWIQGRATGRSFACEVGRVEGSARLSSQASSSASDDPATAVVSVPIEAFDCGNDRMTRDLQETLRMEEHPEIRFELVDARVVDETVDDSTPSSWHPVEALGTLTIAGTKRLMRIQATVRALDEAHFRLRGCTPIRMTYFGIDPPTKALGLIRVHNEVEVQFDLLAQPEEGSTDAPFDSLEQLPPPSCEN